MSLISSLKIGLKAVKPALRRSALTGLKSSSTRLSHDDSKVKPINAPPNDHLNFQVQTLDDLPEPEDYFVDYKANQKKYWWHFILGVSSLSATLWAMFYYELVFFNAFAPELPPKEERIKSFWVEPDDDDDDDDDE